MDSTTSLDHPDFLSIAHARPTPGPRNSSFISLHSIAISIMTPSEPGSDFGFHAAENESPATSTECCLRDSTARVHKAIKDLDGLMCMIADRLKCVSFVAVSGDGAADEAEEDVKVLASLDGQQRTSGEIGKLIVDELDAANLIHANIRLMKCLRAKIDNLTKLERELAELVAARKRGSVGNGTADTGSDNSGGMSPVSSTLHRTSTSTSSLASWNSAKESELTRLESLLASAQTRWSESQETLYAPIEKLRRAKKRFVRKLRQEEKLTRRLTREMTREGSSVSEKLRLKNTKTNDSVGAESMSASMKEGIGKLIKKFSF